MQSRSRKEADKATYEYLQFLLQYKSPSVYASGGASSILLKDGITRAPIVRFGTAKRAAELKFFVENLANFDTLSVIFNRCSRFACSTGDVMGMNMVSKAIIKEEVVRKVLKTTVPTLVELNMLKNLTGSAIAGAFGGFNAHASNIISAVFIATGQDPAQNIESSHYITMMEVVNEGKDLHISVTMPSIEVGTVGGGTQLASQSACLNLLGVKGANKEAPGPNPRLLASIVDGAVLAVSYQSCKVALNSQEQSNSYGFAIVLFTRGCH
ncbi:hypothetical protein IFM89_036550 [Coptis chinensis]|uniref:hydroxymethylglutaryl-CoA reductase (NADPH) n=1 Tax=Coptis chinensis TaxID=261450 RepID=A0A835HJ34_9MAGN|nr:hypothetical protein IFM89_036550 [Coptis chinensis]